jgi:sugar lactone lactonase YvrE
MKINILHWRIVLAILLLTSGAPSPGLCASANLWIGLGAGGGIETYSSKNLKKSGMPAPHLLSTFGTVTGLAFDTSHNLWAVAEEDEVVEFTPAQLKDLKKNSSPTPGVIITSTAFGENIGCNFDHQGNLWLTSPGIHAFYELSKAQLAAGSADITPALVITSSDLDGGQFLAFDADGNLWMDSWLNNTVVEFSASQLSSGGAKSPEVILSDDGSGTSLSNPQQITFDKNGNLWVANLASDTIVEYAKDQLTATGNPTPAVKLSNTAFDGPSALAFNSKGNLVVMNNFGGTIFEFIPSQLRTSGSPAPKVTLTGSADGEFQIIFGPSS